MANENAESYDYETVNYLRQAYQSRYEELSKAMDMELSRLEKLGQVLESLNKTEKLAKNKVLYPIGEGYYFEAEAGDLSNILVHVGGGYYVEKGLDDAKSFLGLSAKKEQAVISQIMKAKDEVEENIVRLEYQSASQNY